MRYMHNLSNGNFVSSESDLIWPCINVWITDKYYLGSERPPVLKDLHFNISGWETICLMKSYMYPRSQIGLSRQVFSLYRCYICMLSLFACYVHVMFISLFYFPSDVTPVITHITYVLQTLVILADSHVALHFGDCKSHAHIYKSSFPNEMYHAKLKGFAV